MGHGILQCAAKFIAEQRRQRRWHKAVSFMGAVVVFITTYALILPAITMERETICGLEEHVHADACYSTEMVESGKEIICTHETLEIHKHTADCKDDAGKVMCGYADFVVHTHNKDCYDSDGDLICPLPEIEEHIHDDSCYQEDEILICTEEEDSGHSHSKKCYSQEKGEFICDREESDGEGDDHEGGDSCYEWIAELTCDEEERPQGHVHSDDCYETERTLDCDQEEVVLHKHTGKCFDEGDNLICKIPEVLKHRHTEECFRQSESELIEVRVLTCGQEEHTHTEACYHSDGGSSDGDSGESAIKDGEGKDYSCGLEEHEHSEDCYDEEGNLICELSEHTHADECRLVEESPQEQEKEYFCGLEEHGHGEDCYDEEGNLICELSEHTHADECLQLMIMPLAAPPNYEVDTVDSRSDGITINLFNYSIPGINNSRAFTFNKVGGSAFNDWTGSDKAYQGILSNTLDTNGYPRLNSSVTGSTQSLDYLFNGTNNDYKKAYMDVNHLFEKDNKGYYYFDSDESYAYYDTSQVNNRNFQVYRPTYEHSDGGPIGFFPFNDYDNTKKDIATTDGEYNHFFGLSLKAEFLMPPDGKIYHEDGSAPQDMVFTFSGDDDAWVFIDDVLVLDIGGVHSAMGGSINFASGVVKVDNEPDTSISAAFALAGRTWNNTAYSKHKMSFYYLERGAHFSNLALKFNLPTFKKENLKITKKVEDVDPRIDPNADFYFQLFLNKGAGDTEYEIYKGPAVYEDGSPVSFDPVTGVFTLRADQTVTVPDLINVREYRVKELHIDRQQIASVEAHDEVLTLIPEVGGGQLFEATSPEKTIGEKGEITFKNIARASLYVEKYWQEPDGSEKNHRFARRGKSPAVAQMRDGAARRTFRKLHSGRRRQLEKEMERSPCQ